MTQMIKVGTAGFYRMRGLLFPGLTDETPDETGLLVRKDVAIKTIQKFLKLWNIDLSCENLNLVQLENLMGIVTNVNILFNNQQNQEHWIKSKSKLLDGKSLLDLINESEFDTAQTFTMNALQ